MPDAQDAIPDPGLEQNSVSAVEADVLPAVVPTPDMDAAPVSISDGTKLPEGPVLPEVAILAQTHPEKIIFSQLKLAGQRPDIDAFAKASPVVANAQDIDKSMMVISEYNRLQNNFSMQNQKDDIIVHAKVNVDEYSSLQNLLILNEFDNSTFFRFSMYGYSVGIVPEDIAKFSRLELSDDRAEYMFRSLKGDNKAVAEFVLMPVYADVKEPTILNQTNFWLMFARIAEFRLWTEEGPDAKLLWFYRAPWYQRQDNSNIADLYGKNPIK